MLTTKLTLFVVSKDEWDIIVGTLIAEVLFKQLLIRTAVYRVEYQRVMATSLSDDN